MNIFKKISETIDAVGKCIETNYEQLNDSQKIEFTQDMKFVQTSNDVVFWTALSGIVISIFIKSK